METALPRVAGDNYPGPIDPLGTQALVVTVEEDATGHREAPWLLPLDGGAPVALGAAAGRVRSPSWSPDGAWLYVEMDAGREGARVGPRNEGSTRESRGAPGGEGSERGAPDGANPDERQTGASDVPGGRRKDGGANPDERQTGAGDLPDGHEQAGNRPTDAPAPGIDVFRLPRAGGEPARLTAAPHGSFEPAVGPDGRVLLGSSRDGNAEIYLMNGDGAEQRRLTSDPADDFHPAWRGLDEIALLSRRSGVARVWRLSLAPASIPRLLRPERPEEEDIDFAFSPDGSLVAITVQKATADRPEVDVEIVTVESGATLSWLDGPGPDEHPAWSPDGRFLAWTSSRGGDPEVWVVEVETGGKRQVTDGEGAAWLPRWGAWPPVAEVPQD